MTKIGILSHFWFCLKQVRIIYNPTGCQCTWVDNTTISIIPSVLHRMPFMLQPSQFILVRNRHWVMLDSIPRYGTDNLAKWLKTVLKQFRKSKTEFTAVVHSETSFLVAVVRCRRTVDCCQRWLHPARRNCPAARQTQSLLHQPPECPSCWHRVPTAVDYCHWCRSEHHSQPRTATDHKKKHLTLPCD